MFRKLNRWIRSKKGLATLGAIVAVILILAVVGQQVGWWGKGSLTGTAGVPEPSFPMPENGYTCLPTCSETDSKFLVSQGIGTKSFTTSDIIAWIAVPGDQETFKLEIFDGDSGKDDNGAINIKNGNWDSTPVEMIYTLYADPLKNGTGTKVVGTWHGNADNMPNNAWFTIDLPNDSDAQAPSGHYFYMIRASRSEGSGTAQFKLRSNAYLSAGRDYLVNSSLGIIGGAVTLKDAAILFPNFQSAYNPGSGSSYNGNWSFSFYIPNKTTKVQIWDGDFDRGTSAATASDTDDPNTDGKPDWASSFAVSERAGLKGAPADDHSLPVNRVSPAVYYELIDPAGNPIYTNEDPSGTEEWENFVLSTRDEDQPDLKVDEIKEGFYNIHIVGLDGSNAVWLRTDYEVCDPVAGCGPRVWTEGMCPRTIGYWKNNVSKVLAGKTKGVQESRESLEWGLRSLALASPIYRHGIDVLNPVAIADPVPMTLEEAEMILQRSKKNYPGDSQSMLARALQQNLATWLNLTTGKIGPTTVVGIDVPSGRFEGTLWEALQEAQTIILERGQLERAKDIADLINNRQLTTDSTVVDDVACPNQDGSDKGAVPDEYTGVIPPDKQPPKYDKMPKAPKPEEPAPPDPGLMPDPNTCGAVENKYTVENTTNNPFYAIKFNFNSGTEVKDSNYDEFSYVIPMDQAAAMSSMQLEAKAGQDQGIVTMDTCSFAEAMVCEPVQTEDHLFAFTFVGATDNGDGTVTLTFQVQNFSNHGLSHASFGLPEGVTPSAPTSGEYTSKVCP